MQTKIIPPELLAQLLSPEFQERFWSKVDRRGPNDCWNWNGATYPNGYGHMTIKRGRVIVLNPSVHRLAWIIRHGQDVPDGLFVLHRCIGNRACCNPRHLKLGTQADNMIDLEEQGRRGILRGEDAPGSKLTYDQVVKIRQLYHTGQFTHRSLAPLFGVTFAAIGQIVRHKSWTCV